MRLLLRRLFSQPASAVQILLASLFITLLGLVSTVYVILVFNRYLSHGIDGTLYTLMSGAMLAALGELGLRALRQRMASTLSAKPERLLGEGLFKTLTQCRAQSYNRFPENMRREAIQALDQVQSAFSSNALLVAVDVPFALLFVLAVFMLHPLLGWVVLIITVLALLMALLGARSMQQASQVQLHTQAQRVSLFTSAQMADTVRAFNASALLLQKWHGVSGGGRALRHHLLGKQAGISGWMRFFTLLMTVLTIGIGAKLAVIGEIDIGVLFGVNILATRALTSITMQAQQVSVQSQATQMLNLMQRFIQLPREAPEGAALSTLKGQIQFKDVAFSYPQEKSPLFESLTLTLEPGKLLVVSGANGSGKTTLARLLVGLLEPVRGSVLIDGTDMRQLLSAWWRQQLIYLPQEPEFLHASIRENLLTLNPGLDDQALLSLLEKVGLRKFMDESPQGLDRELIHGGRELSLGQRRRLALARALTTQGRVAILDEPLEGLDEASSNQIITLLNTLVQAGTTLILLTHTPQKWRTHGVWLNLDAKPVPRIGSLQPSAQQEGALHD
ncbi:ATP-binding cassette domain-containing protein [Magnetococcus sp. PR-3]|uniref:ATP-binding cassette domain-containing protein n=1 Tax=Magnetococcus sp. PR-3 TaxID=3120355 RepID=UPI002FCE0D1C